jgi:nitroreductase
MTTTPKDIKSALAWRYATKVFDPARKLTDEQWSALESALVMSPSGYGLQPWKFVRVVTPELRSKLREAAYGQGQTTDASEFVMILAQTEITAAAVDRFIARTAEVRSASVESFAQFRQMLMGLVGRPDGFEWSARQAYLALGFLLSAAAAMGIDACPMEGIDMSAADKILGVPSGYRCVVGCALGFRGAGDKYATLPKVRYDPSEVVLAK